VLVFSLLVFFLGLAVRVAWADTMNKVFVEHLGEIFGDVLVALLNELLNNVN
jgi:hypothetical protein